MGQIVLLDSGVWAAGFLKEDLFHGIAEKLIIRLLSTDAEIAVPEVVRAETLNVVLHQSLDTARINTINEQFSALSPAIRFDHADLRFRREFMPDQLSRLFLKTMDFLIACYVLYWEVEAFYSFDEKLNKALRRIKPEIVRLKIRRGRVIEV